MLRKRKSPQALCSGLPCMLGGQAHWGGYGGEGPWSPISLAPADVRVPSHPLTENGAFFCNECDCRFSEEASLKRHTLQTHSDKPYKCDRCQASFRYKGNLASHKTVHTGMALPHPT